ncbi:MAG: hypothetical protein GWO24_03450 [Akkermansiaceae bacterium]|nr:hypothetical protein [Akkermansiaceae bacterium]
MTKASGRPGDRVVKVGLVGTPGAGKEAVVRAVAERFAGSLVRAGEIGGGKVARTEFVGPKELPGGGRLTVRLCAVSGQPFYNAVSELVLAGADGVVFAVSLARDRRDAARDALQALAVNAWENGLDLAVLPAALLYYRPVPAPCLAAGEMDRWLGIPTGSVARFVSGPGEVANLLAPVASVVGEIENRAVGRSHAPRTGAAKTEPTQKAKRTKTVRRKKRRRACPGVESR